MGAKQIRQIVEALNEAKDRGRGALCFARCQSPEEIEEARQGLRAETSWRWHEIDAGDVDSGHELLTRARGLSVDPEDVWLAYNLPVGGGARGQPDFYRSMADDLRQVEVVDGARVVFLIGVGQMRAFGDFAPKLWQRKRCFVAWPPSGERSTRPETQTYRPSQDGGAAEGKQAEAVLYALSERLKVVEGKTERARLMHRMGLVLASMGQVEKARLATTKGAKLYKDAGELRGLGQCYELLSSLAERRGNISAARDWIQFATGTWQNVQDEDRLSECYAKGGHLSYVMGDRENAAQQFQLAIEIDEALGNKAKVSAGLRRLGLMAEEEEKYQLAEKLFRDATDLVKEVKDDVGLSRCYHHLGRLYERMGNYSEAFNQHKASLELKEKLGDRLGIATSYHHLGNTYFFTREFDQAKSCYTQALAIEDEVGDNQGRAATLQQLGEVNMAEFRWGDALWYFMAARELWRLLGSPKVHAVQLHIARAKEMLDEETVEKVEADVRGKMSEYQVD